MWSIFRFFGCYPISDDHKKTFEQVAGHRRCTNFAWLVVFLSFLTGLLFLGFYASHAGDISRFFYAVDSYGNQCGRRNVQLSLFFNGHNIPFPTSGMDFRDRPYAIPLDVNHVDSSAWTCAARCPHFSANRVAQLSEYMTRTLDTSMCAADFNASMLSGFSHREIPSHYFTNIGPCPHPPVYKSRVALNRCLPERLQDLPQTSIVKLKAYLDAEDFLRQLFADFYAGRFLFVGVIFVSLAISCYITYQMIYHNSRIVYILYVTTMPCGIVCFSVLFCTFLYNFIGSFFLHSKYIGLDASYERFINGYRVDYALLFALSFLVGVFTFVAWTITWTIFAPRRNLVSELFFQARKPLRCMLWLVVETLCNCIFSLLLFGLWTFVLLKLLSIDDPQWQIIAARGQQNPALSEPIVSAIRLARPWWLRFALVYHFLALLWIKSFLSDAQKIFIAQATSSWYFGDNRKSQWKLVFSRSIYILFRYHLGTVAFGSLLLLFVRVPSHIFLFIHYRIANTKSPTLAAFYNRNLVYLSSLERLLRYIHSNAYAIVAVNGEDFLAACKTATNLWMDNSWYMLTTNTVAALLFAMTRFTFSLTVAFFSGVYFRWLADVEYWLWPTLLFALLAHFVLNRFLTLHQMIIETMFLCYANEIDGYESQRHFSGLPQKADYGFNYYMTRRIYEERRLNHSLGFSISTISPVRDTAAMAGDATPTIGDVAQLARRVALHYSTDEERAAALALLVDDVANNN